MKLFSKKIIILFISAVLIIILHYAGVLNIVENYALAILKPIEGTAFKSGNKIREAYVGDVDYGDLRIANEELKNKNNELLTQNIQLKILQDENEALRKQLEFYSQHNYSKLLANVISREGDYGADQIITIDKGLDDGIKTGQPIIAENGIIVGKIFLVENTLSYAYLITDKNCQIAASAINKKETIGITKGDLGLTIQMNFIPQTEIITKGDIIITSGLETAIPKGLIIGTVQEVKKETNDLFQSVIINPPLNLNTLAIVSIILN